MEIKVLKLTDLVPYENNPRKNDGAVDAVVESIKQCGYVAPIIIDEENVILAGHTRYKALQKLGRKEVEVVIRSGLTEEQKRKYRILDNKTNEFAEWDFGKLEEELSGLEFGGFDFGFDFSRLDGMAEQMRSPEPVYNPDGVSTMMPGGDDPYLPESYDDDEIAEYTANQENYVVKRRIIITYLPEQEKQLIGILGLHCEEFDKVVYDIEELRGE